MLKINLPFSMLLSGASGSGKTYFTRDLLTSDIFDKPINKIIYSYSQHQPIYDTLASSFPPDKFELTNIIPWSEIDKMDGSTNNILVIDDQMCDIGKLVLVKHFLNIYY